MTLSLYLLLTPPTDPEKSVPVYRLAQPNSHRYPIAILDPVRQGDTKVAARHQASRRLPAPETQHSRNAARLGFATRVVFNAMGFMLITSGLMLLLQIAQASLR